MNQQNQDNSNIPKGGHPPKKKQTLTSLPPLNAVIFHNSATAGCLDSPGVINNPAASLQNRGQLHSLKMARASGEKETNLISLTI